MKILLIGLVACVILLVLGALSMSSIFIARRSTPAPVTIGKIENLLRANRKIEAIKLYRASYGCSLKEAKEAIDKMAL